jgi:hypothetical protein
MKRWCLVLGACAIAIAAAWLVARDSPTAPHAPASRSTKIEIRAASWEDTAKREPAPPGYIEAWRVNPPRPFSEPPPLATDASESPTGVDGDRPPRPVPGL